ncbi:saccharopine dehydrogenase NADP-binding domain-containing protein [Arthrobacter sp. A5]|uniref:saccharopine dehydrogenase NADP-binding domain-containing protein n=1 Tax=Arthrobacter sp. A5 TaxID=576926 RepID=UPI003DA98987
MLLVYGTGHLAAAVIKAAINAGMEVRVAGRNPARTRMLGDEFGIGADVASLDEPESLRALLHGVNVVLNAAGPYSLTSMPLMVACIRSGVHYTDASNELASFSAADALSDQAAVSGVALVPGAGFGAAATEAVALQSTRALQNPRSLRIVHSSAGGMSTPGARKSALRVLSAKGQHYLNGRLTAAGGHSVIPIVLRGGGRQGVLMSSGELWVLQASTQLPDISVYYTLNFHPAAVRLLVRLIRILPARTFPVPRPSTRLKKTPTKASSHEITAQVFDAAGKSVTHTLTAADPRGLTAQIGIECVRRLSSGRCSGALTPGEILGGGFIATLDGIRMEKSPRN